VVTLAGTHQRASRGRQEKGKRQDRDQRRGRGGRQRNEVLLSDGFADITLCDRKGAIYEGRKDGMNWIKEEMALVTNREKRQGRWRMRSRARMCSSAFRRRRWSPSTW
jgi:malate dehydrogenase (oxaloacetate-decarboxylating)